MTTGESTDLTAPSAPTDAPAPHRRPSTEAIADVVLTVLLLALFGGGYLAAGQWSFQAGLFPHIVTGAGFVIAVLHLARALLRLRPSAVVAAASGARPRTHGGDEDEEINEDEAAYLFQTAGPRRWAAALGWVAAFFVLLYVAGLYLTAPIFSLFYLRFVGRRTWLFSAIYAVVLGVVLYLAFDVALDVPTPPGLFLD